MTTGERPLTGRRIVVVGAGIAGLTAAFRLHQDGADVLVLEREDRVGGRMSTIEVDGFTIDIGAGLLSYAYTEMLELIDDTCLAGAIEPAGGLLGIMRDNQVHHFRNYRELLLGTLLGDRSRMAFHEIRDNARRYDDLFDWADISPAARLDAEDILSYVERCAPAELIEHFIEPICNDIWLSYPENLSVVNLLFYLCRTAGKGFFSFPAGIGALPEELAKAVPVETSATVDSIESRQAGVTVTWQPAGQRTRTEDFDAGIVAVPAPHVADLCPGLAPEQRDLINEIPYTRSIEVFVGLERPPDEPATWVQMGRTDPDLGSLVMDHNKVRGRVPTGRGLVSSFWRPEWTARRWEADDDAAAADAVAKLDVLYPGLSADVIFTRVQRWDPCVVVHRAGGIRDLERLTRSLDPNSRLQLAGDYFATSTTNSSLCSGARAAGRILYQLSPQTTTVMKHSTRAVQRNG
jgi:oxygen-dependent protoporphyrinogen oxidase